MLRYCPNLFSYSRRNTLRVMVGDVAIGSNSPIVVQSMTTTKTDDTASSVAQAMRIAHAGGEMVRLTAQGRTQAENLAQIRAALNQAGCTVPLIADIHFNPEAAFIAAACVEKVRINPGNFASHEQLPQKLAQLIAICKEHGTSLRIGVNHGSLSERMVEQWGDTPVGMVNSAMEYLELCRDNDFWDVVVSFKSSNVRTMVEAYRLGAATMDAAGLNFPLHLGVTEAGADEDGRIKSAVGIGALLSDGLGDTIRVSLTEKPENEIPVAQLIAQYCTSHELQNYIPVDEEPLPYDPYKFRKRSSAVPIVVANQPIVISPDQAMAGEQGWINVSIELLNWQFMEWLENHPDSTLVLSSENNNWVAEIRAAFVQIMRHKLTNAVIIRKNYAVKEYEKLQIYAAIDFGSVLIDGLGDGVWIENFDQTVPEKLGLDILQATRLRISKTEIISCPGCGRTLFDLPSTARMVKERLGNRAGLKIAVMGCIVNGPGEMADADFGYVGAGSGVVTLYRAGVVVERNIPDNQAIARLEQIIDES